MSNLIDIFAALKSNRSVTKDQPLPNANQSPKQGASSVSRIQSIRKSISTSASLDLLSNGNSSCCTAEQLSPRQQQHEQQQGPLANYGRLVKGSTNPQNALEIRFLLFIEDSDGVRSNIFDSGKYQPRSPIATRNNTNTSNNQFHHNHHNGSSHSSMKTTNGSLPISSSAFNKNNNLNISNAKLLAGSSSSSLNKQENLNNEMLTRMVFGSSPMVVSNRTAIKVHSLK